MEFLLSAWLSLHHGDLKRAKKRNIHQKRKRLLELRKRLKEQGLSAQLGAKPKGDNDVR